MMDAMTVSRRTALLGALGAGAAATIPAACAKPAARGTVRDHLWLWGHGAHTLDGQFGIPDGPVLGHAAAARALGVPNVAVVRWGGKPAAPFGPFLRKLRDHRFGWSVTDSAPGTTAEKIDTALGIADRNPNMSTLWLDDLFIQPMRTTHAELADLRLRAHRRRRPLTTNAVVYATQLYEPSLDFTMLQHVDVVTLWAWDGSDIDRLEEHRSQLEMRVRGKRLMLGVYMWDFGASAPIGEARMQAQLDLALRWLRDDEIEGVVFHSSPLVARPIAEVGMVKRWIARHGSTRLGG